MGEMVIVIINGFYELGDYIYLIISFFYGDKQEYEIFRI